MYFRDERCTTAIELLGCPALEDDHYDDINVSWVFADMYCYIVLRSAGRPSDRLIYGDLVHTTI